MGLEPATEERPKIASWLNRRTGIGAALADSTIGMRSNSSVLDHFDVALNGTFLALCPRATGLPLLASLGRGPRVGRKHSGGSNEKESEILSPLLTGSYVGDSWTRIHAPFRC